MASLACRGFLMDMDDTSSENIKALESYAKNLINAHQEELSYIAKIIDEN